MPVGPLPSNKGGWVQGKGSGKVKGKRNSPDKAFDNYVWHAKQSDVAASTATGSANAHTSASVAGFDRASAQIRAEDLARKTEELKMKLRNSSLCKEPAPGANVGANATPTPASSPPTSSSPQTPSVSAPTAAAAAAACVGAPAAADVFGCPSVGQHAPASSSPPASGGPPAGTAASTSVVANAAVATNSSAVLVRSNSAPAVVHNTASGTTGRPVSRQSPPSSTILSASPAQTTPQSVALSPRDASASAACSVSLSPRLGARPPAGTFVVAAAAAAAAAASAPTNPAPTAASAKAAAVVVALSPASVAPISGHNDLPVAWQGVTRDTPGKARPATLALGQRQRNPSLAASAATSQQGKDVGSVVTPSTSSSAAADQRSLLPKKHALPQQQQQPQQKLGVEQAPPTKRPRLAIGESQAWELEYERLTQYLSKEFSSYLKYSKSPAQKFAEERFRQLEMYLKSAIALTT